jgi:imidazolonepropionase-like amidohydrolase
MRKRVYILLMIFLAGCSPGIENDGEQVFVFRNAGVIDAVGGLRSGQSVIVRGNRIIQTGPSGSIKEPAGATIVDCTGKYLIPGLWDAHVHLTNTQALRPAMFPLLIVNGITYVRDTAATLASILSMRDDAEEASKEGMAPAVYYIGPHMDGPQLSWESSVSVTSAGQAAVVIDSLISAGVSELKVYDLIDREVCLEILSIARDKGFKVSSHVPLSMDALEASNAGMSSVEHMTNIEFSMSADWDSLLQARRRMIAEGTGMRGNDLRNSIYRAQRLHAFRTQDEERRETVLRALADNGTWQVPTLVIIAQEEHRIFAREDYLEKFKYLPEPVRSNWRRSAAAEVERARLSPSEEGMAHARWAYDMVPRVAGAGIGIMAGTDMPLAHLIPGFSLHEELALLVRTGLTPMQVLEAATLSPAQYLGLDHQQGTIGEGMLADLVILDANPLDDITNTRRINAVMRNGHLHTRDDLDVILSQLESQ